MSQQLILALEPEALEPDSTPQFRWCWWIEGRAHHEGNGSLQQLAQSVELLGQQVWLLLPGNRVVVRNMDYSEKEKKHLRNLLPYQLEDAVVGDVEDFHFAFGNAAQGQVTLAYTDKTWLRNLFNQITELGLEISRCLLVPQILKLPAGQHTEPSINSHSDSMDSTADALPDAQLFSSHIWQLSLHQGLVNINLSAKENFSVPLEHLKFALHLAATERGLEKDLPSLYLRAEEETDLSDLAQAIPQTWQANIRERNLASLWQLDFSAPAIDLCQAEFSQRLPLERWWKQWKNIAIFAAITLVVYVAVTSFEIFKANKHNLALRQQIEASFRQVIPVGDASDPETVLRSKWLQLQPKSQGTSAMSLLAGVLPVVASNSDINLRMISYSAETGELNISIQAHSFAGIDGLRQALNAKGFVAELLTANAQGDVSTARIKISKQ